MLQTTFGLSTRVAGVLTFQLLRVVIGKCCSETPGFFWRCEANQPHMTPTNRFVPPSKCSAMADLPTCASPNSFEEVLKLRCKVYWKSVARSTKVPWLLIQHVLPFIWHWTSLFVCNLSVFCWVFFHSQGWSNIWIKPLIFLSLQQKLSFQIHVLKRVVGGSVDDKLEND